MAITSPSIPRPTQARRRGLFGSFAGRRRLTGWLMTAPTIIVIVALTIFPLLYSLVLSFQKYDLQHLKDKHYIGLSNYSKALHDDRVWTALENTVVLVFGGITVEFLLGLGLALVLVDELRGKRFILPVLMLPVMMVPVIVALIWRMLWDNQYGAINQMLGWVVGHDVNIIWLAHKNTAMVAILITQVWQWTPFMFLVLLAGLAGVNPDLYEAASLDGASWWNTLRDITLPSLRHVIAVAILFRVLDAFKIFDLIFMLTQGQPGTSTETVSWYIYDRGRKVFDLGYAASLSYLLIIFLTVLATVYVGRVLRGEDL